jgi:FixJ family two-component response regulator
MSTLTDREHAQRAAASRARWDKFHTQAAPMNAAVCAELQAGTLQKIIAWRLQISIATVSRIAVRNHLARRQDAGQPRGRRQ